MDIGRLKQHIAPPKQSIMSYVRSYQCPLEKPRLAKRQEGVGPSGWVLAGEYLKAARIERNRLACVQAGRRSRYRADTPDTRQY